MSKVRLLQDVQSSIDRSYYGVAGEEVEVVSDNGSVLIVHGPKGKFPVKRGSTDIDLPGAPLIPGKAKPVPVIIAPSRRSYGAPKPGRKRK